MQERNDVCAEHALEIGLEEMEPDHWIAWVLPIPGCYASGTTEHEALTGVPEAWRSETGRDVTGFVRVVERWRGVPSAEDPGFIVNAMFADDRRPVDPEEIEEGIERIDGNHRLFQELVADQNLSVEISNIVRHLATAEQWYFGNIDLAPDGDPPDDPLERFAWIRAFSLHVLPTLADREIQGECAGEGWTPRKVVRRMSWHERDHTRQIAAILAASST